MVNISLQVEEVYRIYSCIKHPLPGLVYIFVYSAGLKGGPGGHVPPRRGCECPKKYNIFHALYDIASIYVVMHTYMITD